MSQPRKNPFMAQGLAANLATLHVALKTQKLMSTTGRASTRSASSVVPMLRMRARPHSRNARPCRVHVQARWIVTEVAGHSEGGRRNSSSRPATSKKYSAAVLRLATSIRPETLYNRHRRRDARKRNRQHAERHAFVDLSRRRLCISSQARLMPGERLGMQAASATAARLLRASRCSASEERLRQDQNRRIHCQFTDISRGDQKLRSSS